MGPVVLDPVDALGLGVSLSRVLALDGASDVRSLTTAWPFGPGTESVTTVGLAGSSGMRVVLEKHRVVEQDALADRGSDREREVVARRDMVVAEAGGSDRREQQPVEEIGS